MDKDLKKGIKKILFLDSLIGSLQAISIILDEADREIDEFFSTADKNINNIKHLIKDKENYN